VTDYLDALARLRLPGIARPEGRIAFLGCGDSLSAALLAQAHGHVALSAGDLAWSDLPLAHADVAVALSWSGRTGATLRAAERAAASGIPLLVITAGAGSPLAELSSGTILLPAFELDAPLPAVGFALHAAAVAALAGDEPPRMDAIAGAVRTALPRLDELEAGLGPEPHGISVASTPDTRAAADLMSLKLIEATGIATRTAPLEETGHVDYFLGPQPHLAVVVADGPAGAGRAADLGAALARNGQRLLEVRASELMPQPGLSTAERCIALGILMAELAARAGDRWGRPAFRGGAVDMSAAHIQVRSGA